MSFWPKEHGAYGQMAFPLVTALAVSGISAPGTLIVMAVLALFLAHEPASVVLGLRGARAHQQLGAPAARWLLALCVAGLLAAGGAIWTSDPATRMSLVVPLIPAVALSTAMLRHQEKSWYGEVSAAVAFSAAAVPVTLAGGATLQTAAVVAIPFALLFVTTTLAVRVVILRVRGGGQPRAAAATRNAVLAVSAGGAALLGLAWLTNLLSPAVLIVAAPGLLTAAALAVWPPPPARLRRVGWTLVALSVLTSAMIVAAM